ncbi:MAG: hypothetical protein AAFX75_07390 [Pseudomonadota bacterium]
MSRWFQILADSFFVYRKRIDSFKATQASPASDVTLEEVDPSKDVDREAMAVLWARAYYDDAESALDVSRKQVQALWDRGDFCMGLRLDDKLVGMQWMAFGDGIASMQFARCLSPYQAMVLAHDSYIAEEGRGRRLQIDLLDKAVEVSASRGAVWVYSFVGARNFASVRNLMRSFDEYQLMTHVKIDIPLTAVHRYPGFTEDGWLRCTTPR